jgi:hypothetical protein
VTTRRGGWSQSVRCVILCHHWYSTTPSLVRAEAWPGIADLAIEGEGLLLVALSLVMWLRNVRQMSGQVSAVCDVDSR